MDNLLPLTSWEPGVVLLENYEDLKKHLETKLELYKNIVYTEDNVKGAKADKASLNKIKKAIAEKRRDLKNAYMLPFLEVESKLKELETMISEPVDIIDRYIKDSEAKAKDAKKDEIKSFFNLHAISLGDVADFLFESDAFFDKKWLNATTRASVWQQEVKEKIITASSHIKTIQLSGGTNTPALINKYIESGSMEETLDYHKKLEQTGHSGDVTVACDEDNVVGYKILKINATKNQMAQVVNLLELLGLDFEEVEDAMPVEQKELTAPDFNSFVAFDIETTGSFGAANGDAPAEITEIGAVKVINGEIVDRVDWLCNPGRKIVPRIARLTNITDEMVADKPLVSEIIKEFSKYIGDLPLVGHNIKSSDLYYISKAAKKAGVAIENPFFDTYLYAKKFKEKNNWENVKLEYLSDYYGIEQQSAHRAYCDAEANVGVYFKLKEECDTQLKKSRKL